MHDDKENQGPALSIDEIIEREKLNARTIASEGDKEYEQQVEEKKTEQNQTDLFSKTPEAKSVAELHTLFHECILKDLENAKTIVIFGKRGTGKTFDTMVLGNLFLRNQFRVHSVLTVSSKLPGCPHINDSAGAFRHGCLDVYKYNTRSCIIIDEVDSFCTPHKMDPYVNKIVNIGRHIKIWAVWNARRPAKVHSDLHSLADVVIVHYVSSEKDIRYIADIADEEFAEKVRIMKGKIEAGEISRYSRCIFVG
jgi:hypothetical protein